MRSSSVHDDQRAGAASVRCAGCGQMFVRHAGEGWKKKCLACWKQGMASEAWNEGYRLGYVAGQERAQGAGSLDKAQLRALLQLCHPDKHAGSDLAHATTTWLLTMKARLQ